MLFFPKKQNMSRIHLYLIKKAESFYNKRQRKRISNKNFSIFSPNCMAGNIYHILGMRFLSPTINCWMSDDDYLKFVTNLDYYLSFDIQQVKNESAKYPIGSLDDIEIHFNHYQSFKEAKDKWVERSKRINFDNMYIIFINKNKWSLEEMKHISEGINCKNVIFLCHSKYEKSNLIKRYE